MAPTLPAPSFSKSLALISLVGLLGLVAARATSPWLRSSSFLPGQLAPTSVTITTPSQGMALTLTDVTGRFGAFEAYADQTGPVDNQSASLTWPDPQEAQRLFQQWGRQDGYQTTFWRPAPAPEAREPIEIRSVVSLYAASEGAGQAFRSGPGKLPGPNPRAVSVPSLGDASQAYETTTGPYTVHLVRFRKANVLATVLVTSFAQHANKEHAFAFAQVVAKRIEGEYERVAAQGTGASP